MTASPAEQPNPPDERTVEAAEPLLGFAFTEAERRQMLGAIRRLPADYAALRAIPLENDVAPPLVFDPRPPA